MPLTFAVVLVPALLFAAPSQELRACVAASENGQRLRDELHYTAARQQFVRCTASGCPAVIQADCNLWLMQLLADQPSVLINTRVGDGDYLEVPGLEIDGQQVSFRLGQPIELDPGARTLVVRLPDGRERRQAVVLSVGEKNRRLEFTFELAAVSIIPPERPQPPAGLGLTPSRRPPIAAGVLTAGVVLAGATFGVLAGLGRGELAKVESLPCAVAKSCNPQLLEGARGLYAGADVAAGVGIVVAAFALWQWIAWVADVPVASHHGLVWRF